MRTALFTTVFALLAASPAFAQWGTIKGQVVWADADPKPNVINVDKDQAHCLAKGQLIRSDVIVDAKTKGVMNVMVWLAPVGGGTKIAKIHPALAAVPNKIVVIDQPMCQFEPRITMMRAGQPLEIRNTAPIAHNTHITGNAEINGSQNVTVPPKSKYVLEGEKALKAEKRPLLLACDIHGWMGGRIGVFDHPYFALTKEDGTFEIKDAPAGAYVIYIQHEKAGWLHTPRELDKAKGFGGSKGQPIAITSGGVVDLGKIQMKAEQLQ